MEALTYTHVSEKNKKGRSISKKMSTVLNTAMLVRHPRVTSDGTDKSDVEQFLFMYDHMCMRENSEGGNASSFFAYHRGEARAAYRSRLIEGRSLN